MRNSGRARAVILSSLAAAAATAFLAPAAAATAPEAGAGDAAHYRAWLQEMKSAPRGPFERIRWFCKDGAVLPPVAFACKEHGGGHQHGELSAHARELRGAGYQIANVFAAIDPERFAGSQADLEAFTQILIERFLVEADDGWIFRAAYSYRGALQAEDEERGAKDLLEKLAGKSEWRRHPRFFLLREAARLLPRAAASPTASEVRQSATRLAGSDPGFEGLRIRIHNMPGAADAARVRNYAKKAPPALAEDYERLATLIDSLYAGRRAAESTRALARRTDWQGASSELSRRAELLESPNAQTRMSAAAETAEILRDRLADVTSAAGTVVALDTSLALESEFFTASSTVAAELEAATRRQRLKYLASATAALYGGGFISARQREAVRTSIARLEAEPDLPATVYARELRYLGRVGEWGGRWIDFHFSIATAKLTQLEPLAAIYAQDRLRSSPLLFFTHVLDSLISDANTLAGVRTSLFGKPAGSGLRALNPGLSRGILRVPDEHSDPASFERNGIYLLPATTAELAPVAGILTRGEGSSLSHVQLLARNLAIPNVVVGEGLLARVHSMKDRKIVLAVSPMGAVELSEDGPQWDAVFGNEALASDVVIRPDLEKLDLSERDFVSLDRLRASDSGRVAGPKAANLGELRHEFGSLVPKGLAIPFGAFRLLLDRPLEPGAPPVFEWMKAEYAAVAALEEGSPERRERVASFLGKLRSWIETVDPGSDFKSRLRAALAAEFGTRSDYGLFVRSDTNVEDLPGFTGAGLNLTLPNVVGFDAMMAAVGRVWASPFTERAYAWRQAHMEQPELVFPAVLLQRSFAAEKSGVMVTADVDTGDRSWLSIAVSEGVGGAVEGQAAEELRVRADGGAVRLMAQATAPMRAELDSGGGLRYVAASGSESVLSDAETARLVALAAEIPQRFPWLRSEDGSSAAADVEFAFRAGEPALLQMRPFVESKRARRISYLQAMDEGLLAHRDEKLSLDSLPGELR